jgi:hypothetical protein
LARRWLLTSAQQGRISPRTGSARQSIDESIAGGASMRSPSRLSASPTLHQGGQFHAAGATAGTAAATSGGAAAPAVPVEGAASSLAELAVAPGEPKPAEGEDEPMLGE